MKCSLVFKTEFRRIIKKKRTLACVVFLLSITNAVPCLMNIENKTEADVVSGMTWLESECTFSSHLSFLIRDTLSPVQSKKFI